MENKFYRSKYSQHRPNRMRTVFDVVKQIASTLFSALAILVILIFKIMQALARAIIEAGKWVYPYLKTAGIYVKNKAPFIAKIIVNLFRLLGRAVSRGQKLIKEKLKNRKWKLGILRLKNLVYKQTKKRAVFSNNLESEVVKQNNQDKELELKRLEIKLQELKIRQQELEIEKLNQPVANQQLTIHKIIEGLKIEIQKLKENNLVVRSEDDIQPAIQPVGIKSESALHAQSLAKDKILEDLYTLEQPKQTSTKILLYNFYNLTQTQIKDFLYWTIKLLLPNFLWHDKDKSSVWQNFKTLFKHPDFSPLRKAFVAWVIFVLVISSTGLYAIINSPGVKAASWYNASWNYRKKITIDNAKVSGSENLTNFPVLINITDIDWKDASNGGHVAQSDGGDILFTASDGTTKLDHEIESYASSTGALIVWVEVPTLDYDDDTEIYIYYGNDSGGLDESNTNGTWNSDYVGVWHLIEDQEGIGNTNLYQDSTSNNYDGDDNVSDTGKAGQISSGQKFDGSDDAINIPEDIIQTSGSLSIWFKPNTIDTSNQTDKISYIVTMGDWSHGNRFYFMQDDVDIEIRMGSSGQVDTGFDVEVDTWYYLTITWDGSDWTFYANGNEEATDSYSGLTGTCNYIDVGQFSSCDGSGKNFVDGNLDELRTYNQVLSQEYIETQYNNQNSPGTFYSIGAEESPNVPPNTPTHSSPSDEAANQPLGDITLTSSAFSDNDAGDTHQASAWALSTESDFSSITWEAYATTTALTSAIIPGNNLTASTTYYWRLQHQDNNNNWSASSTATTFTTSIPPDTPSNLSPAPGTLAQNPFLTLTASAFSDDDAGSSHTSSWWQVRTADDLYYSSPVFDTGATSTALTSVVVSDGSLQENTTYHWQVAYLDEQGIWSATSTETAFVTGVSPIVVTSIGATEYKSAETARLSVQVTDADGDPINDAAVVLDLYDPSGNKMVDDAAMPYISSSDGLYSYSTTTSATEGVYTYSIKASVHGNDSYSSHTFHVSPALNTINTNLDTTISSRASQVSVDALNDISASDVWSYADRSLSDPDSIWEYALSSISEAGSIGKLLKDNIDTTLSSRSSHTAADIWSVVSRTLTSNDNFNDPSLAEIAQNVWQEADRTLTSYGNDITAADVWNVLTSSLTTEGSIGKKVNEDVSSILTDTGTTIPGQINTATSTIISEIDDNEAKLDTIDSNVDSLVSNMDILISGLIVTQGTVSSGDQEPNTTSFDTSLTNSTNDFYNNSVITFTDGDLDGQIRRISDYNGSTKVITVDPALTSAPSNGDGFTIVGQNARVEEQVAEHEASQSLFRTDTTNTLDDVRTRVLGIATTTNDIYSLLQTVDSKIDTVDNVIDALRSTQLKHFTAKLSDFTETTTGSTYRAKLSIFDSEHQPTAPSSTPEVIIYNSLRAVAQATSTMTQLSTGVYEYTYTVPEDATAGVWESIVLVDFSGNDSYLNDYWEVESSPAQVVIPSMADTSISSVVANVTLTNEGSAGYEYSYEYCLVAEETNQCGGGDDVAYASAAKYLNAGENWDTELSLTVDAVGSYYFKVVVYYGTETSGASRLFTATTGDDEEDEEISTPSGSSGSSSVGTKATLEVVYSEITNLKKQLGIEDLSREGKTLSEKVDIVDDVYDVLNYTANLLVGANMMSNRIDVNSPGFKSLLEITQEQQDKIKDVTNKLLDLKTVSNVTRKVIEQKVPEPIIETWMTFGSVDLNFLITNPSALEQTLPFKAYLPGEVKPENIINLDGLKVDFDANADTYYVYGEITLQLKESITRTVKIADIWKFEPEEINSLKIQADNLHQSLLKTNYQSQAVILKNEIEADLNIIQIRQKESYSSPQEHIVAFRENTEKMQAIKNNLEQLKTLVVEAGGKQEVVGRISGIQTFSTWGIIIAIISGFGLLALALFSMWRHQLTLAGAQMQMQAKMLNEFGNKKRKKRRGQTGEASEDYLLSQVGVMGYSPPRPLKQVAKDTARKSKKHLQKLSLIWRLPWKKILQVVIWLGALILVAIILWKFGPMVLSKLGYQKNEPIPVVEQSVINRDKSPALHELALDNGKVEFTFDEQITSTPTTTIEEIIPGTEAELLRLKILNTPTGWLNVRSEPSLAGEILTKVQVGEKFEYFENKNGWYLIKYGENNQGWIIGKYADELK